LKLLGNVFIGVGVLCCLTIIFLHESAPAGDGMRPLCSQKYSHSSF
jgi:hypothetical protein